MSNGNHDTGDLDRRSVLRTLGTGATYATFCAVPAAARGDGSELEIETGTYVPAGSVLGQDVVRAIRSEVERPELGTSDSRATRPLEPSVSDAVRTVARAGDDLAVEMVSIPTNQGAMLHGEFGDGTRHASLLFDPEATYPEVIHDVPEGVESALFSDGSGVAFVREAADAELERIGDVLDADPGTLTAATGPGGDVFQVACGRAEAPSTESRYQIDLSANEVATAEVEPADDGYCEIVCATCTTGLTPCGACASLCLGGISAPACILCVLHTCGTKAPFCYECADCKGWI